MYLDPKGYYARLEVDRHAAPAAIHAAYHRKARVLHPDIPVTGDAAAFVAMKEAYDVLSDPLRRAAYDRSAVRPSIEDTPVERHPTRPRPMAATRTRGPVLSDRPFALWAALALGVLALIAGTEAVLHLRSLPPLPTQPTITANAPIVPPEAVKPAPGPLRLAGTPNVYVIPAGGPAVVWRHDEQRGAYVPIGQLPPFSAVQAVRVLRENGLVEIRLNDTVNGFIDASRLTPGNVAAARAAFCAYNAGPEPTNAEVLARRGSGPGRLTVENRSAQPVVVKLRDSNGEAVVTVFLEPGGSAAVGGLPAGAYRPEYAIGELWSRACNGFAAGMRAQRFADFADLPALTPLSVPPDLSAREPPVDISDQAFEHE